MRAALVASRTPIVSIGLALVASLGLGALAACGPAQPVQAPVIKGSVPAPERTSAPPSIAWTDSHFALTGVPAIARDRSIVVVPLVENDGGRGYPNLRLEVRTNRDKLVDAADVLLANEYEQRVVDGKPDAELARAIDDANRRLHTLHAEHDLVAMKIVGDPDEPAQIDRVFDAKTFRVHYTEDSRLAIAFADGHKPVAVDGTPWRAPNNRCENRDFLKAVYVAAEIDAIVVDIGYEGTDTCWEPADQLHLVTW